MVKTEKNNEIKKKRTLFQKIVNVFLYTGIGLFIIILLIFGASQTSTFREYLRKKVIEEVNQNLYGTVYINKIDGTIFTSLILRKTILNVGKDTILNAGRIELRTSPLQLLLKKIKVRKFEITNANISLIADSTGTLNISKLLPPSKPDTSKSTFPFKIEINNFNLANINFNFQRYDYIGSRAIYDSLNMKDLRVENLNIKLNALADIKNNDYELDLTELSLKPNLNNFAINKLSGQFAVNKKEIFANNLSIETLNSEVLLKIKVDYNLFDKKNDFTKSRIDLNINSDKFNFKDVSPFVPSLSLFNEALAIKIKCDGTFKELTLNQIDIKFLNSHLETKGVVKNLDHPKQMFVNARFKDTYLNQSDIHKLLPRLNLPVYEKLGVLKIDTLTFVGSPLKFQSLLSLRTDKGRLNFDANLNFEESQMKYDVKFGTYGLDVSPFINLVSNLNCRGTIKGSGIKPNEMNAELSLNADGSTINSNRIDNFGLTAQAYNKNINYDLNFIADSTSIDLNGNFNFTDKQAVSYKLKGDINKLDLFKIVKDSSLISSLNFTLDAEGDGFNQDSLNLYLTLFLKNSTINGIFIDSTRAIADIRKNQGNGRVINLISDLADITISGDFTIAGIVTALSKEINLISNVSKDKIQEILPPNSPLPLRTEIITTQLKKNKSKPAVGNTTSMKYLIEFKDFALLSLFLGHAQIEINGEMSGELRDTKDSTCFSYSTSIDYIKYHNNDDVFFLSKLNLDINVANDHKVEKLENLLASLHLRTDRVFAGADIQDILLDINLKNKIANFKFYSAVENSYVKLNGDIDISTNIAKMLFDTLDLNYKGFVLRNKQKTEIDYAKNDINFKNFTLFRDSSELNINGTLSRYYYQNLNVSLLNFKGSDIAANLAGLNQENVPEANINCKMNITGIFTNPIIKCTFNMDSITYKKSNFGSIIGGLNYLNKSLALDFKFISQKLNANEAALELNGNIPIDLAFSGTTDRIDKNNQLYIKLTAANFNLGAFGDLLPLVKRLQGTLKSTFEITGTLNDLKPNGYIDLSKVSFVGENNNLEYNAEMKVTIQ
ncbi:MAG: hypothetical protein P4L27_11240, partial [Ignavibacteriaceae bacterium]|nr:hypothetical protein [Ignavibacteriaceae bacterium]